MFSWLETTTSEAPSLSAAFTIFLNKTAFIFKLFFHVEAAKLIYPPACITIFPGQTSFQRLFSLESIIADKKIRADVKALLYLPSKKTPEYLVLLSKLRQGVKVERNERFRIYFVDKSVLVEDVVLGSYAEVLASRLLLRHEVLKGEELVHTLSKTYRREVVTQLLRDLVVEHKYAAVNLVIEPRYFLHEKVRRLVEVFPVIRSDLVEALADDHESAEKFRETAQEFVKEGLLESVEVGFSPTAEAVKRFEKSSPLPGLEQLRKLNLLKISRAFSLLVFEMASRLVSPAAGLQDPERFVYVRTAVGLQPLSKQLDMMEFVREFYGSEGRVKRIGGLFNSTYVIEVDSVKLFAKRYQSWTDVKWVAARVWTAWVKDFSIDPSTRMAKEIYFLDLFRKREFNTPEIIHVNWRDKILYTSYIEGVNLVDAWVEKMADRESFARMVGETLADVHSAGIRLGDCKPESFIKTVENKIFITDVEQASFDGDPAWDLMELIFYPGHYLDVDDSVKLAENVVEGYVRRGSLDVVRKALRPSYVRTMSLWTPPWVQKAIIDRVKQFLTV